MKREVISKARDRNEYNTDNLIDNLTMVTTSEEFITIAEHDIDFSMSPKKLREKLPDINKEVINAVAKLYRSKIVLIKGGKYDDEFEFKL